MLAGAFVDAVLWLVSEISLVHVLSLLAGIGIVLLPLWLQARFLRSCPNRAPCATPKSMLKHFYAAQILKFLCTALLFAGAFYSHWFAALPLFLGVMTAQLLVLSRIELVFGSKKQANTPTIPLPF